MPKRNKLYNVVVSHLVRDLYEVEAYSPEDAEIIALQTAQEDGCDLPEVDQVWEYVGGEELPEGMFPIDEDEEDEKEEE